MPRCSLTVEAKFKLKLPQKAPIKFHSSEVFKVSFLPCKTLSCSPLCMLNFLFVLFGHFLVCCYIESSPLPHSLYLLLHLVFIPSTFFVLHTLILVINMFFSNTLLKYELLQPLAPICEVCGTAKPKIAKAKYATWSCKFCTLENSTKLDKCSACDQWRYSYGPPVTTYEH